MTITTSHSHPAPVVSDQIKASAIGNRRRSNNYCNTAAEEVDPRRSELIEQAIILGAPLARTLASRY